MSSNYIEFKEVIVGAYFILDGHKYRKNSYNTAKLLETNRVVHFRDTTLCKECKDGE